MVAVDKKKYVEIGRVAYIAHGKNRGKLCTIVDVIDQNRALVDGPCTNVNRQQMNFKALHLTGITIKIPRSIRNSGLRKAWEKEQVTDKWNETVWAKKIANKKLRARLTDFDRFKLMRAKQARNRLVKMACLRSKHDDKKVPKDDAKKKKRKLALKAKAKAKKA